MTKIIYFITPKSMVTIGSIVPILGPSLEFTKKAKKVTEMSDPSRGLGILFNYCFGKCRVYSLDRVFPAMIALGAQFGNMVIDDIIG